MTADALTNSLFAVARYKMWGRRGDPKIASGWDFQETFKNGPGTAFLVAEMGDDFSV